MRSVLFLSSGAAAHFDINDENEIRAMEWVSAATTTPGDTTGKAEQVQVRTLRAGQCKPSCHERGGKWARTSPAAATTRDQLQAVHTAVDTTLDRLAGSEQSQGRRRREKQNGLRSVLVLSLGAAANFDIGDKNEILTGLSARPCTSTWMATGVSGGRDLGGGELGSHKPTTRRWGSTSLVRYVRTQLRARC